jgi:hypothetical protein
MDISNKINMMRFYREATPAVAAVPSAPVKKSEAAVETIQQAKRAEFPVRPATEKKKSGK